MDVHSRLRSDLHLARRADSTQQQYFAHCRKFLHHFADRPAEDLGEAEVRSYLHHLVDTRKVSAHTHKGAVAAIKFLFTQTLGRPKEVARIPWPKVRSPLPVIIAHMELMALFRAADTLFMRAVLLCWYAAGLRVSEVCRLRCEDIDSQRGVIVVRGGKGGKDRLTLLSARLLKTLRRYWWVARPGKSWLFPAQTKTGHIGQRRVHAGFRRAQQAAKLQRSGIRFHSLRHSFATHMLEAGVDIRVLQALLGHKDPATTARYAQVRSDLIGALPDPLDLLEQKYRAG